MTPAQYRAATQEDEMTGCTICGGTAGSFNQATHAHSLCEARKVRGLPTPSLGDRCPTCNGSGTKPGLRGGVMLGFDLHPAAITRSINAQFPTCDNCDGKGRL